MLTSVSQTLEPKTFLRVDSNNRVAIACYRSLGLARVSEAEEAEWNASQPRPYIWMQYAPGEHAAARSLLVAVERRGSRNTTTGWVFPPRAVVIVGER